MGKFWVGGGEEGFDVEGGGGFLFPVGGDDDVEIVK